MIWHVVVNADGLVLAVFGAALLEMAEEHRAKVQQIVNSSGWPVVGVQIISREFATRPSVGEFVALYPRHPSRTEGGVS